MKWWMERLQADPRSLTEGNQWNRATFNNPCEVAEMNAKSLLIKAVDCRPSLEQSKPLYPTAMSYFHFIFLSYSLKKRLPDQNSM